MNKSDRVLCVKMTWRFLVWLTLIPSTNMQNAGTGIGFSGRGRDGELHIGCVKFKVPERHPGMSEELRDYLCLDSC